MTSLFNQYSYLLMSAAITVVVALVLRALRFRRLAIVTSTLVIGSVSVAGWIALRPAWNDVSSLSEAQAILDNGRPTFVEFYSQY